MTEEVKIPTKEELLETIDGAEKTESVESAEEVIDYSEAEQEAISKGWKPEGVEGKRNLSAEEFLDREKFYNDIHNLQRQNKKLQQDLDNLAKFQKKVREDERKRVISELTAKKRQAMEDSDFDKVAEIDTKIFEEMSAKEEEPVVQSNTTEAFSEWVSENRWYNTDSDMREYADTIGVGYANRNPNKTPEEVFEYVTKEVKKHFTEKFGEKPPSNNKVASTTRTTAKPKGAGITAKELSEEERQIMRTIIRSGALTEEEYLKEYASFNS